EAMIEEAEEAEAREEAGVAPAEPAWESGEVLCEVVPGILGPDEIAGARCASVPQPDGTTRYVAVAPDGTVPTVAFGHAGRGRPGHRAGRHARGPPGGGAAGPGARDGRPTLTAPARRAGADRSRRAARGGGRRAARRRPGPRRSARRPPARRRRARPPGGRAGGPRRGRG